MTRLTTSKARETCSDTLNRVAYRRERIVLERHGKPIAALVPPEDVQLLEVLEDRVDLEAAQKALAGRARNIPWRTVKKQLGL